MDTNGGIHLERSLSLQSATSAKSHRSETVRVKPRKHASNTSTAVHTPSDKSLTSFPSLSPDTSSAREEQWGALVTGNATIGTPTPRQAFEPSSSILDSLTNSSILPRQRPSLFGDSPLKSRNVPGAL